MLLPAAYFSLNHFLFFRLQELRNDRISRSEAVKLVTDMFAKDGDGSKRQASGVSSKVSKSVVYKLALDMNSWEAG